LTQNHQEPDTKFEWLFEYFQTSGFQHLTLECDGISIRLSRRNAADDCRSAGEPAADTQDAHGAHDTQLTAPGVGFVGVPPGRDRIPGVGEPVEEDSLLFVLRRFKDVVEVRAGTAGRLTSVAVDEGTFVEFGQPLATID
jgi:biotin carboxyl carrier protein